MPTSTHQTRHVHLRALISLGAGGVTTGLILAALLIGPGAITWLPPLLHGFGISLILSLLVLSARMIVRLRYQPSKLARAALVLVYVFGTYLPSLVPAARAVRPTGSSPAHERVTARSTVVSDVPPVEELATFGSTAANTTPMATTLAQADLSITKSDSPDPVLAGGTLTYVLTITNTGPSTATGATLTDTLPSGVTFASSTPGSPTCSESSGTVTCTLGSLASGNSTPVTIVVTVSSSISGTLVNSASVGSDTTDPDPSDNSVLEGTRVVSPTIQVAKTADPIIVLSGDTVVYRYQVSNPGNTSLTSLSLGDDTCAPLSGPDLGGDVNGNGLLDPNEIWSYSCATTVSADITNTITVTAQPSDGAGVPLPGIAPVSNQDTATVDVVTPTIQIVKTADPTTIYAGETVVYTLTVINPGDTPLADLTVSDDTCMPLLFQGGDLDGDGLLDTTETWIYTCSMAVTADVTNIATASGQARDSLGGPLPGIGPVNDQDAASVNVIRPGIQIVKTASPTVINPGDTVTYTYAVSNTGDDPLTGISVSDDACAPLTFTGGDANSNGILDLGETWTYTCTTTLTQDTPNTAIATGTDSLGSPVSDQDSAFVDVVIAGIQVDKTASDTIIYAGDTVTYTYVVSNTGSDPLDTVVVTDTWCSPVIYQSGDTNSNNRLDIGEAWSYQCVTPVNVDTVNTVTASGLDPLDQPVTDQGAASVDVIYPAINVAKSADQTVVLSGTLVVYTYTVTNPGDDALSTVTVTDTACSPLSLNSGDTNSNSLLDPGETWTYTCSAAISSDTTNIATASGTDSLGNPVSDNDSALVDVVVPSVRIDKSADRPQILSGETVQYSFLVSNDGDVPLTEVSIADNGCSPVTGPDPTGDTNGNGLLDPGEAWRYTCATAVTADTVNVATVSGQPSDAVGVALPGISPVNDVDTASVNVVAPAIQVVKTAGPSVIYAGETVVYTFTVTNTGDTVLANPTLNDNAGSPGSGCAPLLFQGGDSDGDGLLDATETWTYTCSAAETEDTTNTATVTGQPSDDLGSPLPSIGLVSDQDTASVNVINPAIEIVKTASATQVNVSDTVTYTYEVSNPGDDPLTSVNVSDDACAPLTFTGGDANSNGILDLGETWTYTCTTTLTQDTPNTAIATGTDSLGSPVSDQDSAFVDVVIAGIQVDKTASDTIIYAGDTVTYTYVVSNTGADTLRQVVVTDTWCSPVLYQGGDVNSNTQLEPSETWTYQCVTAPEVDTVNTAMVSALDPLTQTVSDEGSARVDVINPAIQVTKAADKTVVLAGDLVVYTYTVTNPGDDPLSNVSITDTTCPAVRFDGGDANGNSRLDPGETWSYTCSAVINSDTINVVTVSGTDSLGGAVSDNDSAFVNVVAPSVRIVKSANRAVVLSGETVQYSFLASNNGDVPLANVSVTDDRCTPVNGPNPADDTDGDGLLDPGETWSYSCVATVSADTTNTTTVSAQPADNTGTALPGINPVSHQDTETVDVVAPAIQVVKSSHPTIIIAGETVVYTFTVTNPGDTPLASVIVTDTAAAPGSGCSLLLFQGGDADGDGLLDTTETWTYTCSKSVTQDTTNTATARGQPSDAQGGALPGISPVTDQDTAFVDVINPGLSIVKTPCAVLINPSDTVTYTYQVVNTGDDPLSSVAVSDDACASATLLTSDGNGLLDPGETWVFRCTTALDDDTTNIATASATDSLGGPVTAQASAFVDTVQAAVDLVKTADPAVTYSGQTVTYTFTVDNIGSDPVFNVLVTDDACASLVFQGGDADGDGVLDIGETWTYICTDSPTADAINTAEVTAEDSLGQPLADADAASVNVINPAINVAKTADPVTILSGDLVQYTYQVTNPGDDPLRSVNISDDACTSLVFTGGDLDADGRLDPGETWTYTCSANPTVDTTNTVTATANDSLGNPVSDQDTATVEVVSPAINIAKSAEPSVILSGDTVVYDYQVTNPGDVPLSGVNVSDDRCAPVSFVSGDTDGDGLLDPGEAWNYVCTRATTEDTANIATASGQPSDSLGVALPGINPVSFQAVAAVDVVAAGINIDKTADPPTIYPGQPVTYTYTVTNTGDTPLANPVVTDSVCSPVTIVSGDDNSNGLLDVNETWTYTCTITLSVDRLNTATASGQTSDVGGTPLSGIAPVSDQDTAFVNVINPAVSVVKIPNAVLIGPGDWITYTYQVINTGDDLLRDATVSDNTCAPATLLTTDGNGFLDPGETWLFECGTTVISDTTNTATVTVTDTLSGPITDQDSAFVNVVQAAIDLVKQANPSTVYSGQVVTYTLSVDNIGSDPIFNVVISDNTCSPLGSPSGDTHDPNQLDADETWTYTCILTPTADTVNTAMVTGQDALGTLLADDDVADVSVISPTINIVKTADPPVAVSGDLVQYTYQATNPGDDPLSSISISDKASASSTGCTPLVFDGGDLNVNGKLDPGETWSYSCSANPTADITNTVIITGYDSLGNAVNDQDTASVDILAPAIEMAKIADPDTILAGTVVTYTYRVTNTGDLPLLSDINVADDTCSPVDYVSGDIDADGLLDPGETWIFECSRTIAKDTTNTATVSGQPSDEAGIPLSGMDPVSSQDTATVDVVAPGIKVEKIAYPTTIYASNSVVYTYTVTNPGDTPLASVAVTDDVCSPITGPAPGGDINSNSVLDLSETWVYTCTTTLATDTANTVTAAGQPSDAGGRLLPGIGPVSDQATAFVDVINPAIAVVKTPSVADAEPGDVITYTYRVTNTGDAPLNTVTVTDDVCSPVTLQTSDGNGLLDPGETWRYTCAYTMQVTDPDPLVNTATAQATDGLGGTVQTTDQASVNKVAADLGVTKSDWPDPVIAGETLTYTLVITNAGPSRATNARVTDTLPSAVTFNSATPTQGGPCSHSSGVVTCNLGNVNSGARVTVTIKVTVDSSTVSPIGNTAQVSSLTVDPVSSNNSASASTTVSTQADVTIVKTDSSDPAIAGETLTYTLIITNNGPSDASSVTVTDSLPSDTVFGTATPSEGSCSELSGTITCTITSLAAGATVTVTSTVTVDPSTPAGTMTNVAGVTSGTPDPNTTNNAESEDTTVFTEAQLVIAKSDSPDPVEAGNRITYTIAYSNTGPSMAADVVITDTIPLSTTFVSASGGGSESGQAPAVVTWNIGTVLPGASGSVAMVVETTIPLPSGTVITNTAHGVAANAPSAADTTTTTVTSTPIISLSKSDAPDPVQPGATLSYTLTYTNTGNANATGVVITDFIPISTTFLNAGGGGTFDPLSGAVTWNIGTVTAAASDSVTLCVQVDSPLAATVISNTASIVSDETLPVTASAQTRVVAATVAGTVYNDLNGNGIQDPGESGIGGVTVDLFAPGADGLLGSPDDALVATTTTAGDGSYTFTGLAAGSYLVTETDLSGYTSTTPNQVPVTVAEGGMATAEFGDQLIQPDVAVDKTLEGISQVLVGTPVTFTVRITNTGNTILVTVPVTDTYDAPHLSFASAAPEPDVVMTDTGQLVWHDLTDPPPNGFGVPLAPGDSVSITIVFTALAQADLVTNTVIIDNGMDVNGDPVSDSDAASVSIVAEPTAAVVRSFTATSSGQAVEGTADVTLRWETVTEIDNLGFNLWRSAHAKDGYERVNRTLIPSQALGTGGASYEYVDHDVPAGTWYYKLETISTTGRTDGWYGPVSVEVRGAREWYIYLPFIVD